MIYATVFSWISTILTIVCLFWCVGLGLYVLVRSIIRRIKEKREMKKDLEDSNDDYDD